MQHSTIVGLILMAALSGCRRSGGASQAQVSDAAATAADASLVVSDAHIHSDADDAAPTRREDGFVSTTNDAPRFLSLSANAPKLVIDDANARVRFTAVLTDPDGIDDLIGGSLLDADSGRDYAAFQTSAAEGSYQVELTIADIESTRAHSWPGSALEFTARFFDQAGNRVEQAISLPLDCTRERDTVTEEGCVYIDSCERWDDCFGAVDPPMSRTDGSLSRCQYVNCNPLGSRLLAVTLTTSDSYNAFDGTSCASVCASVGLPCAYPWEATFACVLGDSRVTSTERLQDISCDQRINVDAADVRALVSACTSSGGRVRIDPIVCDCTL